MSISGTTEFQILRLMAARGVRKADLARAIGMTHLQFIECLATPGAFTRAEIRRIERVLLAPPGWRRMTAEELPQEKLNLSADLTPEERERRHELARLLTPLLAKAKALGNEVHAIEERVASGEITLDQAKPLIDEKLGTIRDLQTRMRFLAGDEDAVG